MIAESSSLEVVLCQFKAALGSAINIQVCVNFALLKSEPGRNFQMMPSAEAFFVAEFCICLDPIIGSLCTCLLRRICCIKNMLRQQVFVACKLLFWLLQAM